MKYSIECRVNGRVYLENSVKHAKEGIHYTFNVNGSGRLVSIKLTTDVESPDKFASKFEPDVGKTGWILSSDRDEELKSKLIEEMQVLEAIFSFETGGDLESIEWDNPKEEFIPENEGEKARIGVLALQMKREHIKYTTKLNSEEIVKILDTKDKYVSLVLPESFFREGINAFRARRYINAFYNFYFVIEDLYGQGKTRNKDVAEAFKKSSEFRDNVAWMMRQLEKDKQEEGKIQAFCIEEKVNYNVEGIIDLIRKVRGNLHHFSSKSSKHTGTPFNNEEFQSVASLTMGLAIKSILQKILAAPIKLS